VPRLSPKDEARPGRRPSEGQYLSMPQLQGGHDGRGPGREWFLLPRRRPIRGPSRRAALGSRNKSLQRPGASRQRPGSTKAFGLAAVRRFAQRRPQYPTGACEPVIGPLPSTGSPTLAKFPANSLLPQKKSLLGIQKFPAPLRREFACKPMDSLAEWRRKLANEPKIFKNSLQIPC
jgi:hypothetical protein